MRNSSAAFIPAALLIAGCWGEVVDIYPDGGWYTTDTGDPPADPEMVDGGGTACGPVDGLIHVYVMDEVSREPISGARIKATFSDGSQVTGETGEDGLATLESAQDQGPVDVEILADGHVAQSVIGLDSTCLTMPVRPVGGVPSPGTVTISGAVAGFDLLAEPNSGEERIAFVGYGVGREHMMGFWEPGFDAGLDRGFEVIPSSGDDTYELTVPAVKGQLYVLAGILKTFGTPDTSDDLVSWSHVGLVGGLDPEPGEDIVDVEVTIEMATLINMLVNYPSGSVPDSYHRTDAFLGLEFGDQGTMWFGYLGMMGMFNFQVPNYYGEYAEGDVTLVAQAGQVIDGEVDDPVANMPQAFKFEFDLETYEGYGTEAYLPDGALAGAPMGLDFDGERFSCFPPTGYSFNQLVMSSEADGTELWRVLTFGDLPSGGVEVPSFPEEWGWDGVPSEGIRATTWAFIVDGDVAHYSFDSYLDGVTDLCVNEAIF